MPRACTRTLALLLLATTACQPTGTLDETEAAMHAALARGDRGAAVELLEERPLGRDPQEVLRLGSLLAGVGELTRARWRVVTGLHRFPGDEPLLLALARISLLLDDPREARAAAQQIADDSERQPDASLLEAQAELQLGNLDAALALYDAYTERYPGRPEATLARIVTLEREHRLEEALAAAVAAEQRLADGDEALAQSQGWLRIQRARLLTRLERPDEASAILQEIVDDTPEAVQAWGMLLELETRAGRGEAASQRLLAAFEEDDARRSLAPLAAAMYRRAGRSEQADALTRSILDEADSSAPFVTAASQAIREGEFDTAFALYAEAIGRFPDDPEPLVRRFDLHLSLGRSDDAARDQAVLEELLAAHDPSLEYLRARQALAAGDAAGARARLERLVPKLDRPHTQYWLGASLEALGDAAGARRRYGMALRRDPVWALPRHALWRHARASSDWPAVVAMGRGLLQQQPDDVGIWASVVEGLLELDEGEDALEAARRGRERLPESPELAAMEARALRSLGRLDEALALLDEAEASYGASPSWPRERALALAMSGRAEEGRAVLAPALAQAPDDVDLLFTQASLSYALGRAREGDRATNRLLALAPERIDARYNRCRFRVASGDYAAAIDDCERAAAVLSQNAEVQFVHGIALERSGAGARAEEAYARAAALDERDVRPRINLAALRLAAGDVDAALAHAQAAYRLDEAHPIILALLGQLYLEKGKAERAVQFLAEASRRDPERTDVAQRLALARRRTEETHGQPAPEAPSPPAPPGTQTLKARLASLERPNIVLVIVDTLRADATTPYGHPQRPTPELERWAERGILFERVRSQSSWTKISMASLMTSLWPRSHGIVEAEDGLGPQATTLAEAFRNAGYATYGVQTNGWLHQSFGFHQGFDHYLFPHGGRRRGLERPSVWPHADRVVAEGLSLLERRDPERPFLLYLHFMDVHEYAAPPEFKRYGTDAKGSYIAAARWVDDAVQRVRQAVETKGLQDDTVFVFGADHGEAFGEHGVHGHARNVLTPVVDVPLVLRLPFALESPLRIAGQVRNVDLAPTLLELAGIPAPESFEGSSLVPLMTGDEAPTGRPSYAMLGVPLFPDASAQSALHARDWTYARNAAADPQDPKAWRSRAVAPGKELLFDRTVDAGENVNLAKRAPDEADRHRQRLDAHLARGEIGVRESGVRIDPGIAEKLRAMGYLQ